MTFPSQPATSTNTAGSQKRVYSRKREDGMDDGAMQRKAIAGVDEAAPWNTPLSDAPKPKTEAEIDAAVNKKPPKPSGASKLSGEPQPEDYKDNVSYNLARKRWVERETKK